jgi:hypothetical protein
MECCVEAENDVAEIVMLWKWFGDKGFEDLPLDDLWD